MKMIHAILTISMIALASVTFTQSAQCASDVLKYEDNRGHLVLVDSAAKIPKKYLNRVEAIPTGKEAVKLNAGLTDLILKNRNISGIEKYFDNYVFWNRWTLILCFLFLLTFLLPLFFRNVVSRIIIFVGFLFLFILFHLFVYVPGLQNRAYLFAVTVRQLHGVSFPTEEGIRYKVLSYRIHSEELPLIPVNIYLELLELRKLQQSIRFRK